MAVAKLLHASFIVPLALPGLQGAMSVIRQIDRWFVETVLPHEKALIAAAVRLCGDAEEARDLVQDVFARMLATEGWQAIGDTRGYMLRMMRNIFIDRLRRSKIVEFRRIFDMDDFDMPDDAPDQHRIIAGQQMLIKLRRAIDTLPEPCRVAFVRRRIHGETPRDIARNLGLSLSTLEKRLARAIYLLTKALATCDTLPPDPDLASLRPVAYL
jgi:RNA polymerase sigma-70 factor (ECF subfamily)